jgi:hypothetical protein
LECDAHAAAPSRRSRRDTYRPRTLCYDG